MKEMTPKEVYGPESELIYKSTLDHFARTDRTHVNCKLKVTDTLLQHFDSLFITAHL